MRDLSIFLILFSLVVLALYRPWIGVLALAVLSYLSPHSYAWGAMSSVPMYRVVFAAVIVSVMVHAYRRTLEFQWPPWDWRLVLLLGLWLYFLFTTYRSMSPRLAWPQFLEVSKVFVPLILILFLIDSRQKLFCLLVTVSACIALVTVKGGYWAVMTGFSDRVYGPEQTAFHDNNHFAVLVVMNIPLLILWLRQTSRPALRYVVWAAIALSTCAAISSWSRGALIALGVTGALLLWHSRRKYLAVPLLILGVVVAGGLLPGKWFDRMETIADYDEEGSAQSRLKTWKAGVEYAVKHPLAGAGFHGWRYVTADRGGGRLDWHSAYVEMMAEHGLVALGLWCALLFGTMASLTRLARRSARAPPIAWAEDHGLMLRASLIAYAVGGAFVGITYWEIPYQLIVLSVVASKLAADELERVRSSDVGNLDTAAMPAVPA